MSELQKSPIPDAALAQHTIVLGKTGAGKSSVLRLLVERHLSKQQPVCIIDPKGDWWGLKSSADGKRPGYPVVIFGGEHADVPINPHVGAQVAELYATGNRPCIIDLGGWSVADRTRFFIDFAGMLFRTTRGPRWLVIDEVHNFVPQGKVQDPNAGKMVHWGNRLITEGRGKGLTVLSASQRPQKVHKDFVTSNETLIAMRVIHPLDRGAIKDWIDGCPDREKGKEVLESLASMKRGEGWVWSPEIAFGPKMIAFPMFSTYDSFKAPTTEANAHPQGWATVDLVEVSAKLAATIEQAKRDDPKILHARIAELERREDNAGPPRSEVDAAAAEVTRGFDSILAAVANARSTVTEELDGIIRMIGTCLETLRRPSAEYTQSPTIHAQRPASRAPAAPDYSRVASSHTSSSPVAPPRRASESAGVALSKAERRILIALAQYPQGRTKAQVAILTGYAVSGGGFNNAISAGRSAGRLEGSGDRLTITPKGLDDLGSYDPLPTGDALLHHWLGQLGKAERAALEALADAYPRAMSKEDCAARAGYEPTGGGFNNALSRLRTLELIGGRGELLASADLFG